MNGDPLLLAPAAGLSGLVASCSGDDDSPPDLTAGGVPNRNTGGGSVWPLGPLVFPLEPVSVIGSPQS
jgi:hypothetical protein